MNVAINSDNFSINFVINVAINSDNFGMNFGIRWQKRG